ncbi:hypothetical protein HZA98_02885 [Candidatus Woesearchaeota archaeon]|nr:hypothetical protein [Candidatus Woesearchaeota archaeon]
MKIVVIIVFLVLLSISFASAALDVPCHTDSYCQLSVGRDVSCVQERCQLTAVQTASLSMKSGFVPWSVFVVQEKNCSGDCPAFAPLFVRSSFFSWLLNAKYSL